MDSTPVNRIPPPAARHSRAKLAAIMAALACAAIPAQAAQGEAAPVFGQIESMLEELRDIMGFGPRRPVAHKTISKAAFRKLYAKRMRQSQKPAEIERQLLFLRLFGLVPDDFDYQKTVLDLLSEQAWALYDFKRRELYLADWAPAEALEYALVHELVHAVDDHHFNLLRYATGASGSEGELARLAAMEGQASWVMTEWAMRRSEKTLEGNRLLAIATASATRFEAQQFPVYGRTPLYFREVLIFPYTDGLLFQDALVRQLGRDGFKRVFERPRKPPSTSCSQSSTCAGSCPKLRRWPGSPWPRASGASIKAPSDSSTTASCSSTTWATRTGARCLTAGAGRASRSTGNTAATSPCSVTQCAGRTPTPRGSTIICTGKSASASEQAWPS